MANKISKQKRREQARQRARNKKIVIICIAAIAVIAIVAIAVYFSINDSTGENGIVYVSGNQTITLADDGTFIAVLAHTMRSGTYAQSVQADGVTTITFTENDTSVTGSIADDVLTLPTQWDDGHGHGIHFQLR